MSQERSLEDILLECKAPDDEYQKVYNPQSLLRVVESMLGSEKSQDPYRDNQQAEQRKIAMFAQKYSFEALVAKYPKPKSEQHLLLRSILRFKTSIEVIESHQTRKKLWMLSSGAKYNQIYNKGLYESLLAWSDYPKSFSKAIDLDLPRTVKKDLSTAYEHDYNSLQNVLVAFSRRNPYVGYCQGLNFIAYFLVLMQFTEEQCFWLLHQIIGNIMPGQYYTSMIGLVCDQKILFDCLQVLSPLVATKFFEVGLDLTMVSVEWFLCLFTSSLPFHLLKIIWDRLFVEGDGILLKASLLIFAHFEKEILEASEFHEIILLLEHGVKNLKMTESAFNAGLTSISLDEKALKICRMLYQEVYVNKKQEKPQETTPSSFKKKKNQSQEEKTFCNIEWPICTVAVDRQKGNFIDEPAWVFKPKAAIKVIHDYFLSPDLRRTLGSKKATQSAEVTLEEASQLSASALNSIHDNLMVGRMEHVCCSNVTIVSSRVHTKSVRKSFAEGLSIRNSISQISEFDPKLLMNVRAILEGNENMNVNLRKSQSIEFYREVMGTFEEIEELIWVPTNQAE